MKKHSMVLGILLVCGVSLFLSEMAFDFYYYCQNEPPVDVDDIDSFLRWKPTPVKILKAQGKTDCFFVAYSSPSSLLGTSPSAYLFDSKGKLVEWSSDMGHQKFRALSEGDYRFNVINMEAFRNLDGNEACEKPRDLVRPEKSNHE